MNFEKQLIQLKQFLKKGCTKKIKKNQQQEPVPAADYSAFHPLNFYYELFNRSHFVNEIFVFRHLVVLDVCG